MPNILDLQETKDELEWLNKKLDIKARKLQGRPLPSVRRGEVYWCVFGYNLGSEIRGTHPCVVIQNNASSGNLRTVIVAPVTHASNRSATSSLLVPITRQADKQGQTILEGYADLANLRTISKARLGKMIARLPNADMAKIDKAIAVSFDLYGYYSVQSKKLDAAIKRGDDKEIKIKALRKALTEIESALGDDVPDIIGSIIHDSLNL